MEKSKRRGDNPTQPPEQMLAISTFVGNRHVTALCLWS